MGSQDSLLAHLANVGIIVGLGIVYTVLLVLGTVYSRLKTIFHRSTATMRDILARAFPRRRSV